MVRRNTKQKEMVLKAINLYMGHPSADNVYELVHKENPSVSKATVYRNLQILSDENVIKKLEASGKDEVLYDRNVALHAHAICVSCGHFIDVDVPGESDIDRKAVAEENGFTIFSHEIIFKGLCNKCREKEDINGTQRI